MRSLETITREVEAIIAYSQDYSFNLELNDLITRWREAKSFYIDKFNGETRILLGHISTELAEDQKQAEFDKMLKKMKTSYRKAKLDELTIEDFILENRESFFENRVSVEHRDLKLTRGMKLTKSFKYFLPFSDCRMLQDYVSRYIQSGGIVEGDLYLSVDPVDFLTSSENNYNWRNCHSLDGDYRSGNLNYMVDNTTLIAYLQTTDNAHLRCCPEEMTWNDKRWRMFIHTNQFNTICYYNRQYPFENKVLFDAVVGKVKELSGNRLVVPTLFSGVGKIILSNGNTAVLTNNYILGERNRLYDTREVFDLSEFNGYFDPEDSPYFTPVFSDLAKSPYAKIVYETENVEEWDKAFHNEFDITIGRACKCVRCGDDHIVRGNSFLCDLCIADLDLDEDDFLKCDCCGARLYSEDEGVRVDDGDLLCQTCYEATRYPVRANNNLRDMLRRRIENG